jgi:metal-responsive CopG/Arc/MetJ family transcriptional regulator
MPRGKPIPVTLSPEIIARLDRVSAQSGMNNRSAVIKFCLSTFLDYIEEHGVRGLPANWEEMVKHHDGRTHRYAKMRVQAQTAVVINGDGARVGDVAGGRRQSRRAKK